MTDTPPTTTRSPIDVFAMPSDSRRDLLEFRRGWIASSDTLGEEFAQWRHVAVGDLRVAVHPERDHAVARGDFGSILMIGWGVDTTSGTWDQETIMRVAGHALENGGWDGLIRYLAYLAGRFLVIAADGREVRVIPDAVATVTAFGGTSAGTPWLASHSGLVADRIGAAPDPALAKFLAEARRASNLVVFRPGARTDYASVRQLLPNHYWRLDTAGALHHERFYPFPETVLTSEDGGFERFATNFDRHLKAICDRPQVTVSLTGGFDSGASFRGFVRHRRPDSYTWTIVNPGIDSHVADARIAGQRSAREGVLHRIVPKAVAHDDQFVRAARATYPAGMQAMGFASTTYSGLPHEIVNIQSMLAEIGTGFYKSRPPRRPTASTLAATYSAQPHGRAKYARDAFADFIEYGQFTEDRFGPWSWYDLLYWESRAGLWTASRVSELELTHRVEMPYNSRHVLEALASGSWRDRQQRHAQRRYTEER